MTNGGAAAGHASAAAAAPVGQAQDAAAAAVGLLASSLGASLSKVAVGPTGPQYGSVWQAQANQQQAAAGGGQGLVPAGAGSLPPLTALSMQLDGQLLATHDAAMALSAGQHLPLTLQQQQQLLLLEQQHQRQQAALQQQYLAQQQLLLQQQQEHVAAQRAAAALSNAPTAQAHAPGWGQLATAGSEDLPPSLLSAALSAAWQAALSAAAGQQGDPGQPAVSELQRAGLAPSEAADVLPARDMPGTQSLDPVLVLSGLLSRQVSPSSATASATAAAAAAAAAAVDQAARGSSAMPLNDIAVAAAAAAAAADQQLRQRGSELLNGLQSLASLPSLGATAAMLGGSGHVPLPSLDANSALSAELHSLFGSWQGGSTNL